MNPLGRALRAGSAILVIALGAPLSAPASAGPGVDRTAHDHSAHDHLSHDQERHSHGYAEVPISDWDPTAEPLRGGLFRLRTSDGYELTTHGPDPVDVMLRDEMLITPGAPERAPVCATGHVQHFLYGHPAFISQSRVEQVKDELRTQVRRMNHLLNQASLESGGVTADYKVACDEQGKIRVDGFQHTTLVPYITNIIDSARAAGFNDPKVDYSIFYDGQLPGVCGIAEFYTDERPGPDNRNNNGGYAVTYNNCWYSRTPMHENGHNQGAVQDSAPSSDQGGHCDDQLDVMCYPSTRQPCSDKMYFDCNYDSYFDSSPEPGEWLAKNWNLGSRVNRYVVFGDQKGPTDPNPTDPRPRLDVSKTRPKKGEKIRFTLSLGTCGELSATRIDLEEKRGGRFKKVASRKLGAGCRTTISRKANFSQRTFRAAWQQQALGFVSAVSTPRRVKTR